MLNVLENTNSLCNCSGKSSWHFLLYWVKSSLKLIQAAWSVKEDNLLIAYFDWSGDYWAVSEDTSPTKSSAIARTKPNYDNMLFLVVSDGKQRQLSRSCRKTDPWNIETSLLVGCLLWNEMLLKMPKVPGLRSQGQRVEESTDKVVWDSILKWIRHWVTIIWSSLLTKFLCLFF